MKIRIQDSEDYLDINVTHPYLLSYSNVYEQELKPKLLEVIDRNNLKCSGCGKPLINRDWICINHRPISAGGFKEKIRVENNDNTIHYIDYELKDMWAMFLFCFDTRVDCINKWKDKRPK